MTTRRKQQQRNEMRQLTVDYANDIYEAEVVVWAIITPLGWIARLLGTISKGTRMQWAYMVVQFQIGAGRPMSEIRDNIAQRQQYRQEAAEMENR